LLLIKQMQLLSLGLLTLLLYINLLTHYTKGTFLNLI